MARTFNEIYAQITDKVVTEYDAVGVTIDPSAWSKYSPRRITCVVVASCILFFEQLLDSAKAYIDNIISSRKTHTIGWYVTKAKEYRHGQSLVTDQDYYDDTGLTPEDIENAQVIKLAAAYEVYDDANALKGVRIKVATLDNDELAPVPDVQLDGFSAYMQVVKDAGVKLYITTGDPDSLLLSADIYYDPLVLDADGKRLDGTNDTPVQDAINNFLKNKIDFKGGVFITSKLVDDMQLVDGVKIPYITLIQAKFGDLDYEDIPVKYITDAGYMRIIDPVTDLSLNFIPYA